MLYYRNTGEDQTDSIDIIAARPDEEHAILLVSEFEFLQNYDFKEFNYFNFEQDITDMSPQEFEWWYSEIFKEWLEDLDARYLDIDFDSVAYQFNSQDEKRVFLLKIVNFVMFLLPYQILRNVFNTLDISTIEDAKEYLENDINLINLRNLIIEEIDNNMTRFDDFIKTLLHFEKVAKKNLVEENIELLDDHVKKQNLFMEIFKGIMLETDMQKFRDYLLRMLENDC
jgi:hypothetical protein